ncbi:MAG: ptsI [Gammaproteobacteria bacterium]|nr:ptsI [Gammaproteobacteria bacterium]
MLAILRQIAQEIDLAGDLTSALEVVTRCVRVAMQVHLCQIYLIDHKRQHYMLMAFDSNDILPEPSEWVALNEGLLGLVAEKMAPIAHLNLTAPHESNKLAFLGVPIVYHRQVLGVIAVEEVNHRIFSEDEEAFLVTLAAQLAGTVVHARDMGFILRAEATSLKASCLQGIPAVPGVAIGEAKIIYPLADLDAIPDRIITDIAAEINRFNAALHSARLDIVQLQQRVEPTLPKEEQVLFSAYLQVLNNAELHMGICEEIEKGQWAEGALRRVIKKHVLQFSGMTDPYLKERAEDILALGQRVLYHLQEKTGKPLHYPQKTILIGEKLTAADLADVPLGLLCGVVSYSGAGNSHVAILARALNVPTIMGAAGLAIVELEDKPVVVDGYHGCLYSNPSAKLLRKYTLWMQEEKELDKELQALRHLPSETSDGREVSLLLNAGLESDATLASTLAASGVGLFRTEISFMNKSQFPTETEQRNLYHTILRAFAPRPVTMRTLDIGGDKALPYLPMQEDNPFLGWRGIRFTLDHPDIFLMQLRAMLSASDGLNNLQIMLPMITSVEEVDEALQLLRRAYADVQEQGLKIAMPKVGVMLEVPAAIYQIADLAKRVDFFSVGSNDLAQYLLAVDRNNARVGDRFDALHPAVLRVLRDAVEKAHACHKPISLCGEIASDAVAAVLLLGLGFDQLSMNAGILLRIKWIIRTISYKQAQELVERILLLDDAVLIRTEVEKMLDGAGLGGLTRAGKK